MLQENRERGAKVKYFPKFFDEFISFKIKQKYNSQSYEIDYIRVYSIFELFLYILPSCTSSHSFFSCFLCELEQKLAFSDAKKVGFRTIPDRHTCLEWKI